MTSLSFVATLDSAQRFDDAHRVQAYLGLTPGEHSSSDRQRRTGITKAGSTRMRWLLVQAAWSAIRSSKARSSPMVQWARRIRDRRGWAIALVALARKMAGLLYALWRDGTTYDPGRAATPAAAATLP